MVVVKDGVLLECGERRQLMSNPESHFSALLESSCDLAKHGPNDDDTPRHIPETESKSLRNNGLQNEEMVGTNAHAQQSKSLRANDISAVLKKMKAVEVDYGAVEAGELTDKEEKEKGRVRIKHYIEYLSAMGMQWVIPLFLMTIVFNAFQIALNNDGSRQL